MKKPIAELTIYDDGSFDFASLSHRHIVSLEFLREETIIVRFLRHDEEELRCNYF